MIRMASAKLAGDSDSAYQGENLADESADSLMM
jgi:hypothetical protein